MENRKGCNEQKIKLKRLEKAWKISALRESGAGRRSLICQVGREFETTGAMFFPEFEFQSVLIFFLAVSHGQQTEDG
jgi:hypothetical protein